MKRTDKKLFMSLLVGVALIGLAIFLRPKTITLNSPITSESETVTTQKLFAGYPKLEDICSCESIGTPHGVPQQFDKYGRVLFGVINHNDEGMCQINKKIWGATAEQQGDDLATATGNVAMAKYIYDKDGNKPWFWSKPCWGKAI